MNPRLLTVSLLALVAHTPASARQIALAQPAASWSTDPQSPQATVRWADLNLRHDAGAAVLRHRVDHMVVELSGGESERNRPDVAVARTRARAQADAVIAAARS